MGPSRVSEVNSLAGRRRRAAETCRAGRGGQRRNRPSVAKRPKGKQQILRFSKVVKVGVVRVWRLLLVSLLQCGARTGFDADVASGGAIDGDGAVDACEKVLTLNVPSTAPWSDTGLDVSSGERLIVKASGVVRYGAGSAQTTDANGVNFDGTKFFSKAVLPNAIVVSLIGKIGGTLSAATGVPVPEGARASGAGFVGRSYDQIAPTSGRLLLGFNDQLT